MCSGHFFQKTADGADDIVGGEECQVIDADDGGGQCGGRDTCVERQRNRKDVREADTVEDVESDEPAN